MAVQLDKLRRVGYHKPHGSLVNGLLHLDADPALDAAISSEAAGLPSLPTAASGCA